MTPLERYLAKQKRNPDEKQAQKPFHSRSEPQERSSPAAQSRLSGFDAEMERKAIEAGAPALPPPPVAGAVAGTVANVAVKSESGGFFPRLLAFVIDLILVSALSWPLKVLISFAVLHGAGSFLAYHAVAFFYYGWFYSEKGATPGKMLLQLEIVEAGTGRKLGFVSGFLRDTLGKYISWLPFGLGYLIAAFRADGKALHDMIFDSRVIRRTSH